MKRQQKTQKTRLAIFDIDGTIFRSSLLIEMFNELVRGGVFPLSAQAQVRKKYEAWLDRKGPYNDYLLQLVKIHNHYHRNIPQHVADRAIRRVIRHHKHRVYRYTRDLLTQLRKKHFLLVAISGSPDYMVHAFAKATGFDAAFGRTLEVRDGTYTGRVIKDDKPVGIFAPLSKVGILKKFIADRGLTVDLRECIAVGDSEGDIELLEAVGHPIAFNPSSFLATVAKRRGWRIIVERKDMVYDIKSAAFIPLSDKPKTRVT